MSFTFTFNPFTAPRNKSRHFSKKIHVPKIPFVRICRVCQATFETRKWKQVFCSKSCKQYYQNHFSVWSKKQHHRLREAVKEFLEKERTDPSLKHHSFSSSKNCLGTRVESTNLKVINVNGQPRIYGTVWLERHLKRLERVEQRNKKHGEKRLLLCFGATLLHSSRG